MSDMTVVPPDTASDAPRAHHDDGTASAVNAPSEAPTNDDAASMSGAQSARPASRSEFHEAPPRPSYDTRKSTQSARPSFRELGHTPRRKVKLGPRPSVDTNGRPRTSGSLSKGPDQRPVASLPAGIRSTPLRKPAPDATRPRSQGSSFAPGPTRARPPVPPLLVPPPSIPTPRAPPSPGAKSLGAMSTMSSVGTNQEKERLMKALQLRKKQMEKRAEEKKNRQATEEKLSPILDVNENKENVDRSQDKSQPVHDRVCSKSEKGKEPLSEIHPSDATDPPPSEPNPPSSDLSKPDSAADMISDSDADQSSNTSPPSTAATPPTEHKESPVPSQIPPVPSEPDTVQEDSGASGQNEVHGPSSTSADVPLENKHQATPETEGDFAQQTATPPSDQQGQAAAETPQSIPPDSASETSTLNTGAPEPQHDLPTPEISSEATQGAIEQKEKRRHHLEPIQVPTPEYSDDDNLSDDSFMDELQSATVEEAKPVSVGKSPLTPGFASNESDRQSPDPWKNNRAVSNPAGGRQSPVLNAGRSVSTPYYPEGGATSVMMAKKINVSSGISSRIKALEKFSSREQPPNMNQYIPAPSNSTSIETLRRRPSVSVNGGNDSAAASRRTSVTSEDARAPIVQRSASQLTTHGPRRQSSVSVTARIVRDPNAPNDSDPTDGTLNLQSSQLTVEHETPEIPLSHTTTADSASKSEKRSMSTSSGGSRRPSLARMGRSDSKMSISSRSKGDAIPESSAVSDAPSSPEEKKESRTSRMMRRMSSITSNSRKSFMGAKSSPVKEEAPTEPERKIKPDPEPSQAIDIGELNIQFPDTLLWKRRFMRIDKGYLVLAPGNIDSTNRNMIKRYHLTEFTMPCLPDEDRQELPNSILLDFLNGSTLQAACESRQGQESVLQSES